MKLTFGLVQQVRVVATADLVDDACQWLAYIH